LLETLTYPSFSNSTGSLALILCNKGLALGSTLAGADDALVSINTPFT
jgi:hypothetical protein